MTFSDVVPFELLPPRVFRILDQTRLPHEEIYLDLADVASVIEAIQALRIRGAPLLGIAGAAGLAVAANERGTDETALRAAANELANARPTAVDLSAIVSEALAVAIGSPEADRLAVLWAFAHDFAERRRAEDDAMGAAGAAALAGTKTVLTHCNTGALATGGIGSALGVIRRMWDAGSLERCFATETRPLLQGARLTAWELTKLGIPVTLLPDTAAAMLIASGNVGAVITGADRIARNGDAANKIGTYGLAVAAARHGVPFYVAAPRSTFDPNCEDGAHIPIEYRAASEVGGFGGVRWSPEGVEAYNPAFDVTPAELIRGFITDGGVIERPFAAGIAELLEGRR